MRIGIRINLARPEVRYSPLGQRRDDDAATLLLLPPTAEPSRAEPNRTEPNRTKLAATHRFERAAAPD